MIGKTISDHTIIAELGRGGMGVIYKAEQVSLSRPVAMKVLSDHLARDTVFVERFLNEARAIAKLNHPNIVQIYNVGQEGQIYYFTMEFIDGTSLEDMLAERPMVPLERALTIISNIAKALAFAHRHGIVHRDIKPSNIMIDKLGTVKLMDFGIAYQEQARRVTVAGGILGTPEYMSPEQASGKTVTAASDIYSLGVVLYEVLTGKLPIEGQTPLETIRKINIGHPPPPRAVRPEIPPAVETIILRMMARDPAKRYKDCDDIRKAIKRFRTGEHRLPAPKGKAQPAKSIQKAKPVPPSAQRIVPARRRRLKVGALVFLLFLMGMAGAFVLRNRGKPPPRTETTAREGIPAAPEPASLSDAKSARAEINQVREKAAVDLIDTLIASTDLLENHAWIQSARIEGQTVFVSGTIRRGARGRILRHFRRLQEHLEQHFKDVEVTEQQLTGDGLSLRLHLQTIPDFAGYLGPTLMMDMPLVCGRVWQLAERQRRAGDEAFRQEDYASARTAYLHARDLYAKTSEVAELEKSAEAVNEKLDLARSEAEEFRFADTVILKQGREIKGEILSRDADSVRIRTPLGLVMLPTAQVSSFAHAPPEVTEALARIRSEVENLQKQQNDFGSMIQELKATFAADNVEDAVGEIRKGAFSVGIGFGIVFAIIVIVFLFTGLSLRPKREITIVCIILLILAGLDWFNVLNHCESPFYAEECLDYPYEHHADVFPGLFPPLLFDEGCTDAHQKTLNPLGWECKPITWQVDEWHFCRANCTINPVSWVYAGMYWYVLACIIVHIPGFFRKKGFTL